MGAKGDVKELNVAVLEATVFKSNLFVKTAVSEFQNISVEIRKLRGMGIENLEGGQGDFIVDTLKTVESTTQQLQSDVAKIAKMLDDKLGKVLEAYKDKSGLADKSNEAKLQKEKAKLTRQ